MSYRQIGKAVGRGKSAIARDIVIGSSELAAARSAAQSERMRVQSGLAPTEPPKSNWGVYLADHDRQAIIRPDGSPAPRATKIRPPQEHSLPEDVAGFYRQEREDIIEENLHAGLSASGLARYQLPNGDKGSYEPDDEIAIANIRRWHEEQGIFDWQSHGEAAR